MNASERFVVVSGDDVSLRIEDFGDVVVAIKVVGIEGAV